MTSYSLFLVFANNRHNWPVPMPMGRYWGCSLATAVSLWDRGGREAFSYRLAATEMYVVKTEHVDGVTGTLHLKSRREIRECSWSGTDAMFDSHSYPHAALMATLVDNENARMTAPSRA
jgi:hypothetical protein